MDEDDSRADKNETIDKTAAWTFTLLGGGQWCHGDYETPKESAPFPLCVPGLENPDKHLLF